MCQRTSTICTLKCQLAHYIIIRRPFCITTP
nr:MAG TPA: hypothetical protein [Caudoviricetes sp.]